MPPTKDPNAPPKFNLVVIGDTEDLPRRVEAYGRHKVLGQVVLVLGQESFLACNKPEGAKLWRGTDWTAPGTPSRESDSAEIVHLIRSAKANTPTKGAKTLNGRWRGFLTCEGGLMGHLPVVVLHRKIASYGELFIESHVNGWTYRFERAEKWFAKPGTVAGGEPVQSFPIALQRGLAAAMGLVQEACGIRDTRARRRIDPAYAAEHPRVEHERTEIAFDTKLRPPAAKAPKAAKPPKEPKAAKAPKAAKPPKEPKAPKAPAAPKAPSTRAPTPYMLFSQPYIKALRDANPSMAMGDAMKAAGVEWARRKEAGGVPASAPKAPKAPAAPKEPKVKTTAPRTPKGKSGPAVDPEKDKLLMAGFGGALRDVLGLGAAG